MRSPSEFDHVAACERRLAGNDGRSALENSSHASVPQWHQSPTHRHRRLQCLRWKCSGLGYLVHPLDIGVDIRRKLPKLGFPTRHLREPRVRRRWYHRRRGCWRRRALRPQARPTSLTCQSQEKHEPRQRHARDRFPASEPCELVRSSLSRETKMGVGDLIS